MLGELCYIWQEERGWKSWATVSITMIEKRVRGDREEEYAGWGCVKGTHHAHVHREGMSRPWCTDRQPSDHCRVWID